MIAVTAEISGLVPVTPTVAFNTIVPIDVRRIFRGRGLMAAIVEVRDQTGAWDEAGQTRRIQLADGSSLIEEIEACRAPHQFDYRLHTITGPLRFLVDHIRGSWRYSAVNEQSRIDWTYQFYPKSSWSRPLVQLIVRLAWMPYMRQVMDDIQTLLNKQ